MLCTIQDGQLIQTWRIREGSQKLSYLRIQGTVHHIKATCPGTPPKCQVEWIQTAYRHESVSQSRCYKGLPYHCNPRPVTIHPNVRCYMRFPVPFISIFCILLSYFTIFTRLLAIKLFSSAQHLSRVCVGNSVINTGRKEGGTGPHKDLMTTEAQNLEKPRDYPLTLPLPTILAKLTLYSQSCL